MNPKSKSGSALDFHVIWDCGSGVFALPEELIGVMGRAARTSPSRASLHRLESHPPSLLASVYLGFGSDILTLRLPLPLLNKSGSLVPPLPP